MLQKKLAIILFFGSFIIMLSSCGTHISKTKGMKVAINTTMGKIVVKLYDETPKTRDNFLKLVKQKFYDSTLFHRVIQTFMIQAGDPSSKKAPKGIMLGNGDAGYTVPAEIVP